MNRQPARVPTQVIPMPAPPAILDQMKGRLRASARAIGAEAEGFVSLALDLPRLPTATPTLDGPQFQFLQGHREEQRIGYGTAAEWRAGGPDRLSSLRTHAQALAASWRQLDPDATGLGGFALLGFAARPDARAPAPGELPNALLRVPEIALRTHGDRAALVFSARLPEEPADLVGRWSALLDRLVPALFQPPPTPLGPAHLRRCLDTPNATGWQRLLRTALDRIAAKELQKVVLARRLRLEGSRSFDLTRLLAALPTLFPSCQIVSIRHGTRSFVAATPERLLSLRGNRVEVDALAGTIRRAAEAERDGALNQTLRGCAKNRHEHRLVIQAIRDALGPCAASIEVPAEPDVMQLSNVQHLWTRIVATLHQPTDVFTLAERLHPTPATNGQPRREASAWLSLSDPFERGWYTGAAGTLEPDLSGDLWVLLRCADIHERTADLYAGAGIVAGSDPTQEWWETEHKLAAMLSALRFA
jgi:salicylate biosynthesis isochorismate synthase